MAIGLGACFGFHFPENFNYPYISRSITEFWRRWHMTLSSWFKEYVYIPLGGNRKGLKRQLVNILIVWTLTGIWHGAGWNFLMWGLWFAFWLIMEKLFLKKILSALPGIVANIYTMLIVIFGWVFFAIENGTQAWNYLKIMLGMGSAGWIQNAALFDGVENIVLFVVAVIGSTPVFAWIGGKMVKSTTGWGIAQWRFLDKLIPAILLIASIAYIVDATYNPFLYFRF